MNPIAFVRRRPMAALMLAVALAFGALFGMYKLRVDIPSLNTSLLYAYIDTIGFGAKPFKGPDSSGHESVSENAVEEASGEEAHKIVVTSPMAMDVSIRQPYVCQIHARNHIEICAYVDGYLEPIPVNEGQEVKKGEVLFRIRPILYKAKLDAEVAEAELARIELDYSTKLAETKAVSKNEVPLYKAKLAKAEAKRMLAEAELNFTTITAPFDGIIDRRLKMEGSLIEEGDVLTTLSDNRVMWAYFYVPEKNYLAYKAALSRGEESPAIDLELADHSKFPYPGKIGAIEAIFNNKNGNIAFRADFPNSDGLLRHGQTGTVVMHRVQKDAVVVPQRATFEILAKRYAFVVDEDNIVHQRDITIQHVLEDIFVIESGLELKDKIILEGIRQVHDGQKVDYEFLPPEKALSQLKHHAE